MAEKHLSDLLEWLSGHEGTIRFITTPPEDGEPATSVIVSAVKNGVPSSVSYKLTERERRYFNGGSAASAVDRCGQKLLRDMDVPCVPRKD